jgi:hypothetical protein
MGGGFDCAPFSILGADLDQINYDRNIYKHSHRHPSSPSERSSTTTRNQRLSSRITFLPPLPSTHRYPRLQAASSPLLSLSSLLSIYLERVGRLVRSVRWGLLSAKSMHASSLSHHREGKIREKCDL